MRSLLCAAAVLLTCGSALRAEISIVAEWKFNSGSTGGDIKATLLCSPERVVSTMDRSYTRTVDYRKRTITTMDLQQGRTLVETFDEFAAKMRAADQLRDKLVAQGRLKNSQDFVQDLNLRETGVSDVVAGRKARKLDFVSKSALSEDSGEIWIAPASEELLAARKMVRDFYDRVVKENGWNDRWLNQLLGHVENMLVMESYRTGAPAQAALLEGQIVVRQTTKTILKVASIGGKEFASRMGRVKQPTAPREEVQVSELAALHVSTAPGPESVSAAPQP